MAKKQTIKKGPVKKKEPETKPPEEKIKKISAKEKKDAPKEKSKAEKVQELLDKVNKVPIADRVGPAKTKRFSEDKYIRVPEDAGVEKFKEMSDSIQKGDLQWAFFAVDNETKGYHYYLQIKK